ncbi:MAG: preprotein translocase subunit SecY, partial [candidate division WOR-3 bacterium]|nr:preprotein translocase subunit SecY [candidate division WOR-3 bacterium]MDW8114657.1 preprotein translocase subunit SecY [candidate division WOR-3 bacterium]
TPGLNPEALKLFLEGVRGTFFGFYDIFVGGALSRASIFALGIMPYISASIIFQLLGAVFPKIEKLQRDEEGRKKINQWTRYLTVLLAIIQATSISVYLENQPITSAGPIVILPGLLFRFITVLTLTAGTIFVMWISELITDRGLGNGASFIIFVGCLEETPQAIAQTYQLIRVGELSFFSLILLGAIIFAIYAGVVLITQAARKIPVQYPKRIIGRKMYGGQSTYIPLRINTAGVLPIIFAQSVVVFPSTLTTFLNIPALKVIEEIFSPGGWLYNLTFAILIIFFTYFYTSVVFNPRDLAENMQRYGGFIPGIRPGEKTAEYLDRSLTLITFPGAFFLVFMALLPVYLMNIFKIPFYFGGTTLLIIVGVALDTIQQIQSHLLMRHYEGLIKGVRIKGRR